MKMAKVKLQWSTPEIDKQIMFQARVSNPKNQDSENVGLLAYCMREGHVSPFEMANMCVEINTTRDIGRQILRHRSFSFQEFSQRYQDVSVLDDPTYRECRTQDSKNRQASNKTVDVDLIDWWQEAQADIVATATEKYETALSLGIAKEQARALLPEGLTMSRMYMNGTIRSWIHYLRARLHESTQAEHREIAQEILKILHDVAPLTAHAFFNV
jgi:thymidylate synthase (FAD)